MAREVKLNQLETVLESLDYPVTRDDAAASCDDVTLRLADGEVNLGLTIDDSGADVFDSLDDLATEVRSLLPRRAVGEPYQSEGEG